MCRYFSIIMISKFNYISYIWGNGLEREWKFRLELYIIGVKGEGWRSEFNLISIIS